MIELRSGPEHEPDSPDIGALLALTQSLVAKRSGDPAEDMKLAYRLAGLMADDAIRRLPKDHPLAQALAMCGQLELPEAHRDSGASWHSVEELLFKKEDDRKG